ncbi:MAG TPA: hypothetical protein VFK15_05870 [Burkholderiales bacterium]|nr:hypothetical protein [Burkholderiales bacterium]
MTDDLHTIHEIDQRRERLKDVARDVVAYHAILAEAGIPAEMAGYLVGSVQDRLIVAAAPETARPYERWEYDDDV